MSVSRKPISKSFEATMPPASPIAFEPRLAKPKLVRQPSSTPKTDSGLIRYGIYAIVFFSLTAAALLFFSAYDDSEASYADNNTPLMVSNAKFSDDELLATETQFDQTFENILSEIAKVEKASTKPTTGEDAQFDKLLNQALKEKFAAKPPKIPVVKRKPDRRSKLVKQQQPVLPPPVKQADVSITGADISQLLAQYINAYQAGDLKVLLSVFVTLGTTPEAIDNLTTSFAGTFKNSQSRQVSLQNINWRYFSDKAIGKGKYQANIHLKNDKGEQIVTADVQIEIRRRFNQVHIARFELINTQVISTNPQSILAIVEPEPPIIKPKTKVRKFPSAAELDEVMLKFVTAYENGDLQLLRQLFAIDAKTDTQNSADGILQEYAELFKSTSDRQLYFQNVKWSYGENYANGEGNIDINVISNQTDQLQLIKGKIQIIAKIINKKVVITQFYHTESSS